MAPKYHIEFKSEGKPFRLVKYFAVASFLLLIIISFPFAILISQGAKDILVEDFFEGYRNTVGENLNNIFSENFVKKVEILYGDIHLGNAEQQQMLDELMKFAIRGSNIESLKIYSIGDGMVVYSTDPKYFKEKVVETPEYKQAVEGKSSSVLLLEGKGSWGFIIGKIGVVFAVGRNLEVVFFPIFKKKFHVTYGSCLILCFREGISWKN